MRHWLPWDQGISHVIWWFITWRWNVSYWLWTVHGWSLGAIFGSLSHLVFTYIRAECFSCYPVSSTFIKALHEHALWSLRVLSVIQPCVTAAFPNRKKLVWVSHSWTVSVATDFSCFHLEKLSSQRLASFGSLPGIIWMYGWCWNFLWPIACVTFYPCVRAGLGMIAGLYRGAISMKLTRAPDWLRLLVAEDSIKKAMVALKLDLTQKRDTRNADGRRTPGAREQTQWIGSSPEHPTSSPPPHIYLGSYLWQWRVSWWYWLWGFFWRGENLPVDLHGQCRYRQKQTAGLTASHSENQSSGEVHASLHPPWHRLIPGWIVYIYSFSFIYTSPLIWISGISQYNFSAWGKICIQFNLKKKLDQCCLHI